MYLKEIIKKNPLLFDLLLLIKHRKDRAFLQQVYGLRSNPDLVELQTNAKGSEKDGILCQIEVGGENDGFFALVRWSLDALYFCDCFSLRPYLRFSSKNLYHDPAMPAELNTFEYYFQQPFSDSDNHSGSYKTTIQYHSRNGLKAELLNGGVNYRTTNIYIEEMAKIWRKYLRFNETTQKTIEYELKKRSIGENVLGVHIRGTDYKLNCKNHPCYITPSEYYKHIDIVFEKYHFQKLYIATDDSDILADFIKQYGSQNIIFADNISRGTGTQGVHTSQSQRSLHKYLLGLEVICDMCALAACGGLISSMSQVSLASRIYKKSTGADYKYDELLNKGINQNGSYFKAK